jgi:molybdopterin-containing oxidoreductase family iron-sulfur binding subunit
MLSDPRERYWRTVDAALARPEQRAALAREFPELADLPPNAVGRRDFVRLLGASLALAGLNGCVRRPRDPILAYVGHPAVSEPTVTRHYATSMTLDGYATGLLVESHTGRPTKIEGNPDHPASLGAAGVFEQASLLGLYDPHRARTVRASGRRSSWAALQSALAEELVRRTAGSRGAGLHLLLEPTASPLLLGLLARVRERYPDCRVHWDAPLAGDGMRQGTAMAFGRALQPVYDFAAAEVVLALDADFLGSVPFGLRYAHDFATRRRIASAADGMSRLYVIETAPSITGGIADHRLRARPSEIPGLLSAVASHIAAAAPGTVLGNARGDGQTAEAGDREGGHEDAWLQAVAEDLGAYRGRCAVVAGERQPPAVHALAHLLNLSLGAVGHTVRYIEPPLPAREPDTGLTRLADAMQARDVGWLVVLEGNPIYTAPVDLELAARMAQVPNTVYLGLYRNETARASRWFVPARHYLESWGDGRAWDGTASLVQPLVEPLFDGHGAVELLAALAGDARAPLALLRADWESRLGGRRAGGPQWGEVLQRGVVPESGAPAIAPRAVAGAFEKLRGDLGDIAQPEGSALEIALVPDRSVHDGRFANNPWLEELPDPITKLTWGNAALLSPREAARRGVESGQMLEIATGPRRLTIPALVVPGHADGAVTIAVGYGRRAAGRGEGIEEVAAGVGADAYSLRTAADGFALPGASVRPLADRTDLAVTQQHWDMEGRPIALHATLEQFRRQPVVAPGERGRPLALYQPARDPGQPQWAMVIDLSACTGCSACVVACQAENNVPVVGRRGVQQSREMHWLRIDRYYAGTPDDPVMLSQPMLCQHCERAPCEYVCPVAATVHSPDGLNEMVYNRCVGTRFCSNNCPYKVRRFNWFDYNAEVSETERLAKNPDVTVRARGVMEKCTFCVQRIREAEIASQVDGRRLGTGEVRTACQQACPTQAIVFGSLTDADDPVAALRDQPRAYSVLHELGTEPRVRYLARITNPNPKLAERM